MGNYFATDSSNWITISDNAEEGLPPDPIVEADYYTAEGDGNSTNVTGFFPFGSLSFYTSFLFLIDRDPPDAIESDALILPNLSASDWASGREFRIMFESTEGHLIEIEGFLTTLVPEPSTVLLLALGGLAIMRNRRLAD